jgi:hypothetical protein
LNPVPPLPSVWSMAAYSSYRKLFALSIARRPDIRKENGSGCSETVRETALSATVLEVK